MRTVFFVLTVLTLMFVAACTFVWFRRIKRTDIVFHKGLFWLFGILTIVFGVILLAGYFDGFAAIDLCYIYICVLLFSLSCVLWCGNVIVIGEEAFTDVVWFFKKTIRYDDVTSYYTLDIRHARYGINNVQYLVTSKGDIACDPECDNADALFQKINAVYQQQHDGAELPKIPRPVRVTKRWLKRSLICAAALLIVGVLLVCAPAAFTNTAYDDLQQMTVTVSKCTYNYGRFVHGEPECELRDTYGNKYVLSGYYSFKTIKDNVSVGTTATIKWFNDGGIRRIEEMAVNGTTYVRYSDTHDNRIESIMMFGVMQIIFSVLFGCYFVWKAVKLKK